jgi:uncharacterized protein YbjT (DUF2867 family)
MIVIFGATGTIGTPLVNALLAKGETLRAVTSDPAKTKTLQAQGCEVAVADFDDPAALEQACAGADKAFLVTPAHPDMRRWKANAIDAAKAAGVGHMVMSTGLGANPKARLTFGRWHSDSQEHLKVSGMDWTLLQPTYFMQNLLWQAASIASGKYLDELGGPVSWVDARDIADLAALTLTGNGHAGKAYGVTGPEALSGPDIAGLLGKVSGREITCQTVSNTDARNAMVASGMTPEIADAMVELSTLGPKGYLAGVETTIPDVLGQPGRRFSDFITENTASLTIS